MSCSHQQREACLSRRSSGGSSKPEGSDSDEAGEGDWGISQYVKACV